jgi:hypothetical protein
MNSARKQDASMKIWQDNAAKTLTISQAHPTIEHIIGFIASDLQSVDFFDLLSPEASAYIRQRLDFEEHGTDLVQIIKHMPRCQFRSKNGSLIPVQVRATYGVAHQNKLPQSGHYIELLIRAASRQEQIDALQWLFKEDDYKQHELFKCLVPKSTVAAGEYLKAYQAQTAIPIALCALRFDELTALYELLSHNDRINLYVEWIERIKKLIQPHDIIGFLNRDIVVIFFLDTPQSVRTTKTLNIIQKLNSQPYHLAGQEELMLQVAATGFDMVGSTSFQPPWKKILEQFPMIASHSKTPKYRELV